MVEQVQRRERRIRVLLAKPGLDGHDRGLLILARAFRDAGMEVVYGGILRSPEEVVEIAIQEDVDVVALSLHNADHIPNFIRVARLLREKGAGDKVVVGGGIIPPEDKPVLESEGISGNFGPGTPIDVIIDHIVERVRRERWREVV
ncbi:MAG: cobalamin B12-binding domain-containing protein [Thaumarchaeota archaeon]|nr:cobalamin B12-binding domain-containing protein [Candidatus Calditenuaceae archaeon]MDW8187354.1 cobalamin B12-binding domain-containing protein [Nitrososphaerota archaeon]